MMADRASGFSLDLNSYDVLWFKDRLCRVKTELQSIGVFRLFIDSVRVGNPNEKFVYMTAYIEHETIIEEAIKGIEDVLLKEQVVKVDVLFIRGTDKLKPHVNHATLLVF
jgi:hypothetical protein